MAIKRTTQAAVDDINRRMTAGNGGLISYTIGTRQRVIDDVGVVRAFDAALATMKIDDGKVDRDEAGAVLDAFRANINRLRDANRLTSAGQEAFARVEKELLLLRAGVDDEHRTAKASGWAPPQVEDRQIRSGVKQDLLPARSAASVVYATGGTFNEVAVENMDKRVEALVESAARDNPQATPAARANYVLSVLQDTFRDLRLSAAGTRALRRIENDLLLIANQVDKR